MIVTATLRDYTWVAAHMRAADWREISCQCRADVTPAEIALWSLAGREAYTAFVRGQPVACVGVHNATPAGNVLTIWCWGASGLWRAVPEITEWVRTAVPRWISEGVTRVEARSADTHLTAHRWMLSLGATVVELPRWGRNGEPFKLFSWTKETWEERSNHPSSRSRVI